MVILFFNLSFEIIAVAHTRARAHNVSRQIDLAAEIFWNVMLMVYTIYYLFIGNVRGRWVPVHVRVSLLSI